MSTNKTCAISSLRWRPVSALIYGFAYSSKHESVLPLSPKFPCNNRKQKNSSILMTGERKGWTVSQRRDNPAPGAGIICRLWNRRRHDKVSWVLPRRWRDYSALLACHEQTTHLGPRPEKAAVAREIARASSKEKSERWKLGGQISGDR